MIAVRRASQRRYLRTRGQETWMTFFAEEPPDPGYPGFGGLQRIDEELRQPGSKSSPQRCEDTEIVTYVREGALNYHGSVGGSGVIQTGEFQLLAAGRGLVRKEANSSPSNRAQVFQLWMRPSIVGVQTANEQKRFSAAERRGELRVVASADSRQSSLRLHLDALLLSSLLTVGQHVVHELTAGRAAWLHVVQGEITLEDLVLTTGDGVGLTEMRSVSLTAAVDSEILLIDLATPTLEAGSNGVAS